LLAVMLCLLLVVMAMRLRAMILMVLAMILMVLAMILMVLAMLLMVLRMMMLVLVHPVQRVPAVLGLRVGHRRLEAVATRVHLAEGGKAAVPILRDLGRPGAGGGVAGRVGLSAS